MSQGKSLRGVGIVLSKTGASDVKACNERDNNQVVGFFVLRHVLIRKKSAAFPQEARAFFNLKTRSNESI